jgi:hypothetical protein
VTNPYTPTTLATAIVNPAVGGFGQPIPYLSNSAYKFAPTAMDVESLVQGGTEGAQAQALYDTIRRASAWADRYCFGADPAAKGASLAATLSVEAGYVKLLQGELRLVCDYKPIIDVRGIDVGLNPANVQSIGASVASAVRIGRRTIYVPYNQVFWNGPPPSSTPTETVPARYGRYYAVWSYTNGYPHTSLAANVTANSSTVEVTATDGAGGLLGVYPGTQMTIVDESATNPVSETFTVQSIAAATPSANIATITTTAPLLFAHTVPASPDFIPVTALPEDVRLAVIFLATSLIKTRGDLSVVLDQMEEPKERQESSGDVNADVAYAMELLDPYRIRIKGKS